MYTKLVPETVHFISFTSKFIWNHLYINCIIYMELPTVKSIFIFTLEHHTGSSVKLSIQGKMSLLSLVYLADILLFIFPVITREWLLVFLYSNVSIALIRWYSFPFCSVIILWGNIIK